MRKIFSILVIFLLTFQSSFANTYSADPQTFIKELVNDAINTLSNNSLSDEEKVSFIENIAIDNVDIKSLGLYTLGEIRKTSEKTSVFADNFVKPMKKALFTSPDSHQ